MRKFDYTSLIGAKWDSEILGYVSLIHEYKGRQDLLIRQQSAGLDRLVELAKIQSTEASNAIEGIRTTSTRLRQLVGKKTAPRNRDEQEIAGYRDVLSTIHDNYEYIDITSNYILQLHKMLFSHSSREIGGAYKSVQNYISSVDEMGNIQVLFTPLAPYETAPAMEKICAEFSLALSRGVEPLLLVPTFIHDFLCIHPFLDGNGRMSRLLTSLLLYKCGYNVGKYISLETKIADSKIEYYDALSRAQNGWHEGVEDNTPFIKYLLGTILSAYRDIEDRLLLIGNHDKPYDVARSAIDGIIGAFTKADLLALCPSINVKTMEKILAQLQEEDIIVKHGVSRGTNYTKKTI